MIRKPPEGFDSWIKFHDYLKAEHPILFDNGKTILTMKRIQNVNGEATTSVVKINLSTLRRYCWLEIQDYRVGIGVTHEAGSILHQDPFNNGRMTDVIKLLWKLEIHCDGY